MKFDNILFPLDFSQRSIGMKSQVEELAQRFGSRVTVLHVFEIPATWCGTAEAPTISAGGFQRFYDSAVANLAAFKLDLPDMQVEKVLLDGDPAWIISDWAREHPTDLIMMGTRGFGRFQGLLLGSVVSKIIHDTQCPVWTDANAHRDPSPRRIDRVLCALDVDEEAIPLLRFAAEVSRQFTAKLEAVHCVPGTEARSNKYFEFDLQRYLVEGSRIELTKLQREAATPCEIKVETGDISTTIRKLAAEKEFGLIVLGRGESQRRFGCLRTHAYQIIHEAPCPVLSYCPAQSDRISSSYSEAHPCRSVRDVPPPIGSNPL
jgi:nucleotide-binding universal stress UspA family protein